MDFIERRRGGVPRAARGRRDRADHLGRRGILMYMIEVPSQRDRRSMWASGELAARSLS